MYYKATRRQKETMVSSLAAGLDLWKCFSNNDHDIMCYLVTCSSEVTSAGDISRVILGAALICVYIFTHDN